MPKTALADAFAKAKYPTAEAQIYAYACEMLKLADGSTMVCHRAIERAHADMNPKKLSGHSGLDAQRTNARQNGGHRPFDDQSSDAAETSNGAGPIVPDAQLAIARPVASIHKEPTREAIKARGEAAKAIAVTIMDTYRLSSGAIVGDLYWATLHKRRAASAQDMFLLRLIQNHAQVSDPENTKVRDVVKIEDLQRMIQKAAELADAM